MFLEEKSLKSLLELIEKVFVGESSISKEVFRVAESKRDCLDEVESSESIKFVDVEGKA